MTRARHIIPSRSIERIERLRILVNALYAGPLTREEMGDLLKIGPSGVRKYLVELRGKVAEKGAAGEQRCSLTLTAAEAADYLASLAAQAATRPPVRRLSDFDKAARDPARHFHILADDAHYAIRLRRAPIVRDPLVEAFFGPRSAAMGAHA